jgi:hypothetical protein
MLIWAAICFCVVAAISVPATPAPAKPPALQLVPKNILNIIIFNDSTNLAMPAPLWQANLVNNLEEESSALAWQTCKKVPQGRNFSHFIQRENSQSNSSPAASPPAPLWQANLVNNLEEESSALSWQTCKKVPQGRNFSHLIQRELSQSNPNPAASPQRNFKEGICQLGTSALAQSNSEKGPPEPNFSQVIQREGYDSDPSAYIPRQALLLAKFLPISTTAATICQLCSS